MVRAKRPGHVWHVMAGCLAVGFCWPINHHPSPTYSTPLENENPGHGIHGCNKVKTALGQHLNLTLQIFLTLLSNLVVTLHCAPIWLLCDLSFTSWPTCGKLYLHGMTLAPSLSVRHILFHQDNRADWDFLLSKERKMQNINNH